MAGGTKRLPRAVREQQMLDAAVQMFSVNGYHETSMDAIAAKAEISKPMLYSTTAPRRICSARAWTGNWPGSSKRCAPRSTSR